MKFDKLSNQIIGCAIEVHKALGPGLLESTYEQCLAYELNKARLRFELQKALPVDYKGCHLDCGYRIDILVEDQIIVELKAVEKLIPLYEAQLLTYMKLSDVLIGLLINFNVLRIKDGIRRFVY